MQILMFQLGPSLENCWRNETISSTYSCCSSAIHTRNKRKWARVMKWLSHDSTLSKSCVDEELISRAKTRRRTAALFPLYSKGRVPTWWMGDVTSWHDVPYMHMHQFSSDVSSVVNTWAVAHHRALHMCSTMKACGSISSSRHMLLSHSIVASARLSGALYSPPFCSRARSSSLYVHASLVFTYFW
jgi:hypothetical protein